MPHSSLGGLIPRESAETTAGLRLALVSTVGQSHLLDDWLT
jgi:hypothetical protein